MLVKTTDDQGVYGYTRPYFWISSGDFRLSIAVRDGGGSKFLKRVERCGLLPIQRSEIYRQGFWTSSLEAGSKRSTSITRFSS